MHLIVSDRLINTQVPQGLLKLIFTSIFMPSCFSLPTVSIGAFIFSFSKVHAHFRKTGKLNLPSNEHLLTAVKAARKYQEVWVSHLVLILQNYSQIFLLRYFCSYSATLLSPVCLSQSLGCSNRKSSRWGILGKGKFSFTLFHSVKMVVVCHVKP